MGVIYHFTFFSQINQAAFPFGAILIVYAIVIYPIIGAILGHTYPASPVFGVAPCPTTIFTFGLLLWTRQHVPWWLLIISGIWFVIGFTAAIKLGIKENIGLLVAGIITISMLIYRNRTRDRLDTAYV